VPHAGIGDHRVETPEHFDGSLNCAARPIPLAAPVTIAARPCSGSVTT
jgi:hypothetical protein